MPAPPYSAGTDAPSSPISAICGRMPWSKRCSRSRSLIFGATSRAAHSRTDRSRICCSSERSKSSIRTLYSACSPWRVLRRRHRAFGSWDLELAVGVRAFARYGLGARDGDGGAAAQAQPAGGAGGGGGELEMIGAAEKRADTV